MKRTAPWAAPAVPDLRAALRQAFVDMIARYSVVLQDDPDKKRMRNPAQIRKRNKLVRELAESLDEIREELQVLDRAKLFWVARDMVPVAVSAAATLPEWTPDLVLPAEAGFLCWAKPAGTIPFAGHEKVPWDAAWWWRRGDGILQIQVGSRLTQRQDILASYGVSAPLWSGTTLLVDPRVPRTAEVEGNPEASEFVSVLGATWLLMDQRTVAETRALEARSVSSGASSDAAPSPVSMVVLRKQLSQPQEDPVAGSGRMYRSRWSVEPHWRQQACGPRWSQRKPVYITEYTKGPRDAPVKTDKVSVWRR
jgi:hypothetical protein